MNSSAKANAEIAKNDKGENPTNGSSQSISLTANLVYELWRDAKIFGAITPENKIKLTNTVSEHTATFKRALTTN